MSIVESGMTAIANIGTSLAAKAASATYQEANAKSLSEYSKELQLVPTFAIEKEILNDANMGTLIETALANYAGYYIIAMSIDNTINGVSVGRMAGKYNPNRDAIGSAINVLGGEAVRVSTSSYKPTLSNVTSEYSLSTEKANFRLPNVIPNLAKDYTNSLKVSVSTESFFDDIGNWVKNDEKFKEEMARYRGETLEGNDVGKLSNTKPNESNTQTTGDNKQLVQKEINELKNLAAGKILNVSLTRNGISATVNVLLKPTITSIKSVALVGIAGLSTKPMSMRERWVAFWDRETINSAWDYLTCRDLAEAHKRNLVEDTTGYYEKTHNRSVNNKVATLVTGEFSVGTVANTWIISDATASRIEVAIGGRLSSRRARDKFMAESGCMTLIVYNPDYQRVFIYNHGLEDVSEISMNYLQKKSKSESFDMDVFKLLSQGSAPII